MEGRCTVLFENKEGYFTKRRFISEAPRLSNRIIFVSSSCVKFFSSSNDIFRAMPTAPTQRLRVNMAAPYPKLTIVSEGKQQRLFKTVFFLMLAAYRLNSSIFLTSGHSVSVGLPYFLNISDD